MELENKNYYELLGLERDASTEEIKQAFKDIALVYHPDSNFFDEIMPEASLPPEDMKLFKAITQAYNTLSNEEKRKAYDAKLSKEEIASGVSLTNEWVRPDGSLPKEQGKVRERAPTITNLQKLHKQYEESVVSKSKPNRERVATVADMKRGRIQGEDKFNGILLASLVIVAVLILVLIIIIL